jgi:heptosyltransferase-3
VTLLQGDLPCVPCGKAGCEDHRLSGTECLPAIAPERVAQEALALLRQRAAWSTEH